MTSRKLLGRRALVMLGLLLALAAPLGPVLMPAATAAVSTVYQPQVYSGDGSTAAFAFPYQFFQPGDVGVQLTLNGALVMPAPVLNGAATYDYAIAGTRDAATGEYLPGATVTFNNAPPAGYVVTLSRAIAAQQPVVLGPAGPLPPKTLEAAYDRAILILQQLGATLAQRVLQIPANDPAGSVVTLPGAAQRAGTYLCFDASGNLETCPASSNLSTNVPVTVTFSAAALAALPTVGTARVMRVGYAGAGDAPEEWWFPLSGDCAANSLASDGGDCLDTTAGDHNSWKAVHPGSGVDNRQFGASSTASAAVNTAANRAASAAAYRAKLPLVIAGGDLAVNPELTLYSAQVVNFAGGTCLIMQQDGVAVGTLRSPGAAIDFTNGNNITVNYLCVDMQRHHGTTFLNRGGRMVTLNQPVYRNIGIGAFTDTVAVSDSGTTTGGSSVVTGLSHAVAAVGMAISDSRGCIPDGTQVAQRRVATNGSTALGNTTLHFASTPTGVGAGAKVFDGNNFVGVVASVGSPNITLTATGAAFAVGSGDALVFSPHTSDTIFLSQNTNLGDCGPSDQLSLYPVLTDAAHIWLGHHGWQQADYGTINQAWGLNAAGTLFVELASASYSGHVLTFAAPPPASIVAATANAITGAAYNNGLAYFVTTTNHGVAAGNKVCITGMSPAGWNVCDFTARGTLGNEIVLPIPSAPGNATVLGQANYFGSFVADVESSSALAAFPADTFVNAVSGNTITLSNPPTGGQTDDYFFTTAATGFLGTATGDDSNPNVISITGAGVYQGFAAGVIEYQGGPLVLADNTDVTTASVGVVIGGSGRGISDTAAALGSTVRNLYSEAMMSGYAIELTADSTQNCAGSCGGNAGASSVPGFPSFSGAGAAAAPILDRGTLNSVGEVPFTPVLSCNGTPITGTYQSQKGRYMVEGNKATVTAVVKAPSGATCAGPLELTLPVLNGFGLTQGLPVIDNTTGTVLAGTIANPPAPLAFGNPTATDTFAFNFSYFFKP